MEYKVVIGGITYPMSKLSSVTINQPLFQKFGAGNACSAKIEVVFLHDEEPPAMSEIVPYCRENPDDDWVKLGVFFADERSENEDLKTLVGYDAMLKSEVEFLGESSGGVWPRQMQSVVSEIAQCMGVEIDPRTELNPSYMQAYPLKYTMRELLKQIAVAHGGNWIMTREGKLYLVPLFPASPVTRYDIGMAASKLKKKAVLAPITGIDVLADDEYSYFAGDDTGYVMEMSCPSITQDMVDNLLAKARGFVYKGFEAECIYLPPTAELAEEVTVADFTGFIANRIVKFGSGYMSDVSAPGENEVAHEYQPPSAAERAIDRKIAKTKAEIQVSTDEIKMSVDDLKGNMSQIDQKIDGISLSVSGTLTDGTNSYVEISLHVGDHVSKGYVIIDGNVTVSGQLSAEALYAAMGDIADLTVDKLSTSRRIVKYLANDQSDDNYIRVHDQYIEFISGVYAGGEVQATDPNGSLIYWEQDISGASIGSDGYPYLNGARIFTTCEQTDWPVMVYTYTELVKRSISFEQYGNQYVPVDVFGAGDASGRQKGKLVKDSDGLNLTYETQAGKTLGLMMGDGGYTDILGMRKTSGLNFSEWDSGRFYERVDGDNTRYVYNVEFDAQKRPTKITDADGHEMFITW